MADELKPATETVNESAETVIEEVSELVDTTVEAEADIDNSGENVSTDAAMDEGISSAESVVVNGDGGADTPQETIEEVVEEPVEPATPSRFIGDITFSNATKNPAAGLAMTLASLVVFTMGMDTYFQKAMAWTFLIWGLLLLFVSVLNIYQRYEARAEGLSIRNPIRFWSFNKFWEWTDISRIDVLSGRRDNRLDELDMHIYREIPGELVKEREDVKFNPDMAQVIIERAGLQPVDEGNPSDLDRTPLAQKAIYHWTKSGSIA